ncbi:MAG: ribonuclease H-like domain-containing protein [Armatimonadota bacterium]|nr:ribonuclease H-like domain-containing protein [Armatimonadota bacterium]
MLTSTFIHAQGIGEKTEKSIWQAGILTWEQFLTSHDACRLSARQRSLLLPIVEESVTRLRANDYSYFASILPSSEQWRAFREFGDKAAYLDIETLGMGADDAITVIGVYDGENVKSYIKGHNMEQFLEDIERYHLLVTYAGAMFDLPHIRRAFPGHRFDQIHIDLCPALRRIGLKGGLKGIEKSVGLERPSEIAGMDGWAAVRLWREYEWGSKESLDLLVKYNAYDVINLKPLAERAYEGLRTVAFGLAL